MHQMAWNRLLEEVDAFTSGIRDLPVLTPTTPAEVRAELERRYSFEGPIPIDTLVAEASELLRRWTVHVTHPRYFGLFNPSVREAAMLGDALAALFNPQLAAWSHAPAANEIERHVLRRFTAALGWDPDGAIASFASGGAEANLSAVLSALAHRFPESGTDGVGGLERRPAIYLTGESHHSFVKIARMAGLGTAAVREVPVTDGFTMDPAALAERIHADRSEGWAPLVIVGTAGTTSAGAIDPLPELAEIAADAGAWFHVDGAWGASAALSPRLRPLLRGIERADSVTWDAHKWLSVPMGAGMFFCRHPEAVRRAFAVTTSYMPGSAGDEADDPYSVTPQWSRRAIGLKVFLALAELGIPGYAELIEGQADAGERLREMLRDAGWTIVNDTDLPVVCFTHPAIRGGEITTATMLRAIHERGRIWISDVVLGGRERVLRACITSYLTGEDDLRCLVDELEAARGGAAEYQRATDQGEISS